MFKLNLSRPSHKIYKIGTRQSLLATTQTKLLLEDLKQKIKQKYPRENIQFEIVTFTTQGDGITDKPLWQLEGKDFFTKELDQALIEKKVDFVIHSYKDLGSDRPKELMLAAIPKRQFPHDILLIKKQTVAELKNKKELLVGTSSPRRIYLLEKNLPFLLPKELTITTKMLRGNVNTRLQKLQNNEYDAIVLAMAGLERLASHTESYNTLKDLSSELDFMILPASLFPPAAAQGALAVEILKERNDKGELLKLLKLLDDPETIHEVSREKEAFKGYGGGCHLAMGVHVSNVGNYFLHQHRGRIEDEKLTPSSKDILLETVEDKESRTIPTPPWQKMKYAFIGLSPDKAPYYDNNNVSFLYDEFISKAHLAPENIPNEATHLFVTSDYCFTHLELFKNTTHHWSAGTKTWMKLARKGYWVSGSSDGLGHERIQRFQNSRFLNILTATINKKESWAVLSHDQADSEVGATVPCYSHTVLPYNYEFIEKLKKCQAFYWTSFWQFKTYAEIVPEIKRKSVIHASGLGKTSLQFAANFGDTEDFCYHPFASIEAFKNFINSGVM